ncbi:MAG: benzoylformate decarboxylase [Parvularculaceae bacterium]
MTIVRDSIYAFMRETGMTTVFGNPGSTELPFYRDWPDEFRYVLGLQESAVLSMADGFAQATGKAALVNLHSAAGLGHALGSLVTAYKNQTPLVVTAGQQSRRLLLAEPFLGAVDAASFPKPYVKWAHEAALPSETPRALARAWAIAMTPPRGPVFLSIPADDWEAPAEFVTPLDIRGASAPSADAIATAAAQIDKSAKPVIVAGGEVDKSENWSGIATLAEKLACPVWTASMSPRGCFPESHPQFAGFLRADHTSVAEALGKHDLILVIGAPAFTFHFDHPSPHTFDTPVIQITCDANTASYTRHGLAMIADLHETIAALTAATKTKPPFTGEPLRKPPQPGRATNGFGHAVASDVRKALEPLTKGAGETRDAGLTSLAAIDLIQALRPADCLIAEEAPSARMHVQQRLRIDRPQSFFATASGGLGFAASAAVGLALGKPDRHTLALLGDGSSLYTIQALWTAAQENAPVIFVILNNGGYEALKMIAQRMQTPSVGADLPGLDFLSLAKGFGLPAKRATTAAGLHAALSEAFSKPRPMLIDVIVNDD